MSLSLGTRLGVYEVTAKIGEGGMGKASSMSAGKVGQSGDQGR